MLDKRDYKGEAQLKKALQVNRAVRKVQPFFYSLRGCKIITPPSHKTLLLKAGSQNFVQKIQNFDLQEKPVHFSLNFFHPSVCNFE